MAQTKHFKSKEKYDKFLAYEHMHGVEGNTPSKVTIAGKKHKVNHKK